MNINETHVSLLVRAFKNDPLFVHLFSGNKDQSEILIRFILKRNRLSDGLVLTDHESKPSYAAIVERPENLRTISLINSIRLNVAMFFLLFQLPFRVLRFLTAYDKLTSSQAPDTPHYYVTMIGVDPSQQGKGIGKQVLREIHDMAETPRSPYPVALDTENHQNIAYYKSIGYVLKHTDIIQGIRIYCMIRPA